MPTTIIFVHVCRHAAARRSALSSADAGEPTAESATPDSRHQWLPCGRLTTFSATLLSGGTALSGPSPQSEWRIFPRAAFSADCYDANATLQRRAVPVAASTAWCSVDGSVDIKAVASDFASISRDQSQLAPYPCFSMKRRGHAAPGRLPSQAVVVARGLLEPLPPRRPRRGSAEGRQLERLTAHQVRRPVLKRQPDPCCPLLSQRGPTVPAQRSGAREPLPIRPQRRFLGGGPAGRGGAARSAGTCARHQFRARWHAGEQPS